MHQRGLGDLSLLRLTMFSCLSLRPIAVQLLLSRGECCILERQQQSLHSAVIWFLTDMRILLFLLAEN